MIDILALILAAARADYMTIRRAMPPFGVIFEAPESETRITVDFGVPCDACVLPCDT